MSKSNIMLVNEELVHKCPGCSNYPKIKHHVSRTRGACALKGVIHCEKCQIELSSEADWPMGSNRDLAMDVLVDKLIEKWERFIVKPVAENDVDEAGYELVVQLMNDIDKSWNKYQSSLKKK